MCIDWQGEEPVHTTATAGELRTKQTGDEYGTQAD